MTNLPDKAFYRPDEIAKFYSVSRSTIYLWIEEGKLPAVKLAGSTIRISRDALPAIERPV